MNSKIIEVLHAFRHVGTRRTVCDTPVLEVRVLDGKYGIVNRRGRVVLPFRYHNIYSIAPGQIVLSRMGKLGLLRILWDSTNRRFCLRQTLKCDYDSIERATDRIFILRRRGRYSWYRVDNGSCSGEYDSVTTHGDRFVEGCDSYFENCVLCDLYCGQTHLFAHERHVYLGRNGDGDVLLSLSTVGEGCRLLFSADDGTVRLGAYYSDILPICQGEECKCFLAKRDGIQLVCDRTGNVIWQSDTPQKLSLHIADLQDRPIWGMGVGFDFWDRPPRYALPKKNRSFAEIARHALYSGPTSFPLQKQSASLPKNRKWGYVRLHQNAPLRRTDLPEKE